MRAGTTVLRWGRQLIAAVAILAVTGGVALGAPPQNRPSEPDKKKQPPPDSDSKKDKADDKGENDEAKGESGSSGSDKRGRKPRTRPAPKGKSPRDKNPKKPGSDDEAADKEPAQEGANKPVEIPPDVQRQIDELMAKEAAGGGKRKPTDGVVTPPSGRKPPVHRATDRPRPTSRKSRSSGRAEPTTADDESNADPRRGGRTPRSTPGSTPPRRTGAESSTKIEIPAVEGEDLPAEERVYEFAIKNGTFEQLLEGVARQTGLGMQGDAPRDERVSFVTEERLNFEEMLSRVRMLLFNYKPHEPYWLLREKTHLKVIRVNDMYRDLEPTQIFRSVEDYRAANLRDEEIAMVIYTPSAGSIARLNIVRDFMPDYVRVAQIAESNSVTIFALVRDINKYFELVNIFIPEDGDDDPRSLEVIEVQHLVPTDAWTKIETLMDLESDGKRTGGSRSRRKQPTGAIEGIEELSVSVVPDDARGVLIVRAMADKIAEIKKLLPVVDVPAGVDYPPVIVPLTHLDAEEIVPMIEQLLSASAGDASPAAAPIKSARRGKRRRSGGSPDAVTANDVVLLPHPMGDSIIVIGSEEDVATVREYVKLLDRLGLRGPELIAVNYADPTELVAVITQLVANDGGGAKSTPRFSVVPDPGGTGIWFTGPQKDYEKVIEIVTAIDVQEGHDKLHVIRLENQLPSFVVSILEQYDSSDSAGAAAATSSKRGRRRRAPKPKAGASAVGKFTADDENMRLFVFCTDEEWQGYLEIIKQLEEQIDPDGPPFVLLAVEHVDPAAAMEKLKTLVVGKSVGRRGAQQAKEEIRFEVSDTDIIVTGAAPEEIDLMRDLLAVFDMPLDEEIVERIFEFKHVDTEHMVGAIQALISSSTTDPKRRMPRTAGKAAAAAGDEGLTIVTVGNRTVVRTTPENMDRIVALVQEFDVPDEENTLRVYDDFPPTADIQAIADTLTAMLAPGAQRRVPKQASAEESQLHIIAQPDVGRIVVLAPPSQFAEIEELLEVLRVGGDITSIETAFAEVHFADPDEVVALVQPMLSMKVAEFVAQGLLQGAPEPITIATAPGKQPARPRRDGHSDNWFHLAPDHRHRRVVIAAPQIVIDEAKELVAQFDYRGPESELVTRTVELENATANEMARIIREMMSGTMRRDTRPRRQPADPAGANTLDDEFGIFEAPGGMAVVLRGSQELVDQANEWVSELDALQTRDRDVKVYTLKVASPKRMVDILMATLDTPQPTQRAQKRPVRSSHRGGFDVEEDDEPEWETEIKRHGTDLFIMADTISRTLTISAPPAKLARADELVAEFDQEDVPGTQPKPMVPRFTYELEYADAFDASFELDMVIDAMWSYEEKPRVESAMFGGDVLIIEYPDESKFPEIVELIEKYVDKRPENADEDIRTIVPVPEGMTADEVARWITNKYADIDIELVNRTKRSEEDFDVDRVRPRSPSNVNPCALPTIGRLAATGLLVETLAIALPTVQTSPDEQPDEKQEDEPPPPPDDTQPEEDAEPIDDSAGDVDVPPDDDVLQSFTREVLDTPKDQSEDRKKKGKSSGRPLRTSDQPRGKLRVIIDSETGEVILEGRPDVVNDVEETYEEYLEEEGAGREGPPDIRIYRVKYIDVFTATDIIEEMFNATRQQRAQVQQQQRLAQQRARQQQRQQQQQQRQQQQQGKSGQQDPQGRGQQQQQQQQQVPQLPPTNVRVYPNPRDRTLILRADASQYPALLELLATIDQPQPIERKFKTFRLEKLNAVEVEEMLSGMLGLDEAGSGSQRRSGSSRRSSARRTPGAGIDPGSPLPVNIMAGKADGTGVLGVDPEDISISSNEEANTILVMAPQEAIDYIGDLIEQFENYEVPERIWKNYKLQHANAGDVVEYLLSYFEEATTTPGVATRGRPSRGRSPSGAPSLNSPTVVAYERLNLVSVQATEEQIVEVDDIVARLDVRGEVDNWQSQTLTRADAAHVADTLTQMFGGGAAVRGPRGKPATTGPGPSFIGEEGGRVLFYAAPENLQEDILAVIEQIESETESEAKPHVITLVHAEPSAIATALEPVYGQRRQRRMGRGGAVGAAPEFSVSAHDASNRLFVVTDDETFTQVESLVRTMDVPATVDFDFRIYPLRFADAKKVHGQMKKLITDYMRQLGVGRGGTSEPFSVEVDEKTNALVVLGGPAVFGFLEENLAKIDIPANARSPKGTMIVTLESADAQEVAQTINQLWSGRDLPEGETPPQAQANRTTNTLVVRGNQEQLDEIKKEFVDKIEEQKSLQLLTETITLAHADPEAVAESINRIFDDKRDAMLRLGRDSNVSPVEFTVVATPDFATKQIIVQASESNLDLIKARVAELDKPENADAGVTMQIYPIKHADPNAVVGIIKEWARSRTQDRPGGRVSPGDIITATAEPQTQTVVVTASAANHLIVKEMIDGLDSDSVVAAGTRTQHTIPLQHASADELAQQLMQLYRQMPRRRGDVGPGFVGDPNSNALMVVATQDELQELQALVQSLDVEAELERKQQLKSFRLEAGDPWAVQDAINRMFPPGRDPRDRVTAVAEGGSNSVVVAASPENMARVEELISQLDLADGVQKDVYVINLKNADADQVARTLNEIFVQSLPRTRGQSAPPISISALSGSRAILVKCNADDYAEIAEAVTALDSEETIGDEVRVVTLQYGDATEMQQALQETISKPGTRGGRGGELIGDARIAALPSSNAIVITGTADIVEKLEAKVIQLDNVGREGALPKAIPLQHARLSQVMPKLKDMFVDQRGNRRGQEPVVITGDDVTNAVIVRASPTEFAAINAVVEQLDTEVAGNTKNYRIVQVSPGVNLDQLAEQVEIAVNNRPTDGGSRRGSSNEPEVTILADSRTHSLTISGSPALFDDAEQLIKEYEQMGPMGGRATAVVQVQNRAVEDIQRLIDQLTQTGGGGGSDRARRSGRDSSRRRSPATRPSSRRPSTNRRR